jgi:hypothetical protein
LPNIKTTQVRSSAFSQFAINSEEIKALIWSQSNEVQPITRDPKTAIPAFDKSDFFMYVADSMVDAYKEATNWSTVADKIKGISELPQEYKSLYGYE